MPPQFTVIIRSPAQEVYATLEDLLKTEVFTGVPKLLAIYDSPTIREPSRAESARYAGVLAEIAVVLSPLTDEALLALQRLSLEAPTGDSGYVLELEKYDPPIKANTKSTGDQILDLFENNGFDRAEKCLLWGSIACLASEDFADATVVGHVAEAMSYFVSAITTDNQT